MISLDERYLKNTISTFIIEVDGNSVALGLKHRDKLIIDRSLEARAGDLVLMVMNNSFVVERFSPERVPEQNYDSGDFVWGVVTAVLREFKQGRA